MAHWNEWLPLTSCLQHTLRIQNIIGKSMSHIITLLLKQNQHHDQWNKYENQIEYNCELRTQFMCMFVNGAKDVWCHFYRQYHFWLKINESRGMILQFIECLVVRKGRYRCVHLLWILPSSALKFVTFKCFWTFSSNSQIAKQQQIEMNILETNKLMNQPKHRKNIKHQESSTPNTHEELLSLRLLMAQVKCFCFFFLLSSLLIQLAVCYWILAVYLMCMQLFAVILRFSLSKRWSLGSCWATEKK